MRWKALLLVLGLVGVFSKCRTRETVSVAPLRVCLDHPTGDEPAPFIVIPKAAGANARVVAPDKWRWFPKEKHKRLVLRVRFINGDSATRARVKAFANEWTKHAFVTFKYVNDPDAEIRIRFATDGISQTAIGSQAKSVTTGPTMR